MDTKNSSGSIPLEVISEKHVIRRNNISTDSSEDYKWARTSEQAKEVKNLHREFMTRVHETHRLSLYAKKKTKEKKAIRVTGLIEKCRKSHSGPLTNDTVNRLDKKVGRLSKLTDEQIRLEGKFLKATVAPELKLRERVADPRNPKKYTMPKIDLDILKISIRNILKPQEASQDALDAILSSITI